jgi:hypothetical protein
MGRPSTYTEERAQKILAKLREGQTLTAICNAKGMPTVACVNSWKATIAPFNEAYMLARVDQADSIASHVMDIADDVDEDHNSRRIRMDARKWLASKLMPGTYGDRIEVKQDTTIRVIVHDPRSAAQVTDASVVSTVPALGKPDTSE